METSRPYSIWFFTIYIKYIKEINNLDISLHYFKKYVEISFSNHSKFVSLCRPRSRDVGFPVHRAVLWGGPAMGTVRGTSRARAASNMAGDSFRLPTGGTKQLYADVRCVCYTLWICIRLPNIKYSAQKLKAKYFIDWLIEWLITRFVAECPRKWRNVASFIKLRSGHLVRSKTMVSNNIKAPSS